VVGCCKCDKTNLVPRSLNVVKFLTRSAFVEFLEVCYLLQLATEYLEFDQGRVLCFIFYIWACIVLSLYVKDYTNSSGHQACCTVITPSTPEEVIKTRISPSSLTLSHYDTQR
jgi:hypothetical protein